MDSVANIILYFVVALVVVVCSCLTVLTHKILRAATYLLFVLIGTAIFYFQLGYQFLGVVQRIGHHRRFIGATVAIVGGVLLLLALFFMPISHDLNLVTALERGQMITMEEIGKAFTGTDRMQYLLPFEAISVLLLASIIGGVTVARKR